MCRGVGGEGGEGGERNRLGGASDGCEGTHRLLHALQRGQTDADSQMDRRTAGWTRLNTGRMGGWRFIGLETRICSSDAEMG